VPSGSVALLPGMPPPLNPRDLYAADRPGDIAPVARRDRPLVYVPNVGSGTVSVIDPNSDKVIRTVRVGAGPEHVVPSWDLKTLWVNNDAGNSLTPINPVTGSFGKPVPVDDPYNLYFTPDGGYALVIAEALGRIDFRNPQTMALRYSLHVPCLGINHLDFTADGRHALASCEFSGQLLDISIPRHKVVKTLKLGRATDLRWFPGASQPQDVRLAPDGRFFYVADLTRNGVWLIDAKRFRKTGFIHTGKGAHGLLISRNTKDLFVSNRDAGSLSVISFATRKVIHTWRIPGGGSPDMGGIPPDGKVIWLSGRYNGAVYAISARNGHLIARIPVGAGPHGLSVFPQPGRYSLGHTGNFR
jgi:YVTN family beta-propeller protein